MTKYLKNYKNLKIVVTGSTGFKGSWLCFWLDLLGANVTGIGLKPEKNFYLFDQLKLNRRIEQRIIDIRNFKKVDKIIREVRPDLIFHLAAQSIVSNSYNFPLETFNTNILGSANILESFKKNKVKGLVYITSDKCYLNLNQRKPYNEHSTLGGLDNYSSSKACAELIFTSYLNSYNKKLNYLNMVSARAGNVIGGGDAKYFRLVPDLVKSILKKKTIQIRNPNSTRPWQHVLEPLSGYLLLGEKVLNKKLKSNIYPSWNFGPEKKNCKPVKLLVKRFLDEWDIKKKIKLIKNNEIYESNLLSLEIKKALKELNWRPKLSFNQTIKMTVDWYKTVSKKEKVDMQKYTENQIDFYLEKKK